MGATYVFASLYPIVADTTSALSWPSSSIVNTELAVFALTSALVEEEKEEEEEEKMREVTVTYRSTAAGRDPR